MTAEPKAVQSSVRAKNAGTEVNRSRSRAADSAERIRTVCLDPYQTRPHDGHIDAEVEAAFDESPIAAYSRLICQLLLPALGEDGRILVIAPPDPHTGCLFGIQSEPDRFEHLGLATGVPWIEGDVGTEAIRAAVRRGQPVTALAGAGSVGLNPVWRCTASPVVHRGAGRLLGVIALAAPSDLLVCECTRLVRAAARLVECEIAMVRRAAGGRLSTELLEQPGGHGHTTNGWARQETLVPPEITLRLLGPRPPEVTIAGRTTRLTQRRADLLALLARNHGGMSADAIADQLYGDGGQPGTVRTEVHRIRRHLGGGLASHPYRFTVSVTSDAEQVERLLQRGDVQGAVRAYTGPLLPRSDLLAIEMLRQELHETVRQAAMAVGGDALAEYCRSPAGELDLEAWSHLHAASIPGSVARATVSAHLGRLSQTAE